VRTTLVLAELSATSPLDPTTASPLAQVVSVIGLVAALVVLGRWWWQQRKR
jgi:hypothetical protein